METPLTIEAYTELPKYAIHKRPGSDRIFVKDEPLDATHGDSIHDSVEDAEKHIKWAKHWEEHDEKLNAERGRNEREAAEREAAEVASFKGFKSDNPLGFGRARKTLSRKIRYHGKVVTRKEFVESKLAEGWYPEGKTLTDGEVWVDVTKTEADYAAYLLENTEVAA